jgi:hypothetical protein
MSTINPRKSSQFEVEPYKFEQDQTNKDQIKKDRSPLLSISKNRRYHRTHGAITIAKAGAKTGLPFACGGEMGKSSRRLDVSAK